MTTPWYPTEDNPISGVFVKELKNAVSLFADVEVIHVRNVSDWFKLDGCDVVHVHVYKTGVPALLMKKLGKVPYVVTEHYKPISGKWVWAKKLLTKIVLENADLLVLPSRAMLEEIRKLGIDKNAEIVPNTVNTDLFKPKEGENGRILFVGGLDEIKGIYYLLRALKDLSRIRKDFRLDIVGDGDIERYSNIARTFGIDGFVEFHGVKDKRDIAEFMGNCSFLVLPSLWESQGCVLIEAMASGKPVIATSCGGPKEIVKDFCGVMVPPKNWKALSEAMNYMLDNHWRYDGKRISEYARAEFGYEAVGKRLVEIYRRLL